MSNLEIIKDRLERKFNSRFTVQQEDENVLFCSCRGWGQWEVPYDEDEEDCDFEELSDESSDELSNFISELRAEFPNNEITYCTGEKNYIDFRVRKDD